MLFGLRCWRTAEQALYHGAPSSGWICGCAVSFKFIGGPLLYMLGQATGHPVSLPVIETKELWPLLMGMLGLAAYRTVKKVKGAD